MSNEHEVIIPEAVLLMGRPNADQIRESLERSAAIQMETWEGAGVPIKEPTPNDSPELTLWHDYKPRTQTLMERHDLTLAEKVVLSMTDDAFRV